MDGVLIDAKEWHYEALNEALRIFGKEISRFDHLTVFDGKPTKDKLNMLTEIGEIPKAVHDIINIMKQKFTMRKISNLCSPNFNHQVALSKLKKEGYKMAVCSNSIRQSVEFMLRNAGIIEYFDFYISNEDVVNGKPDPEMYQTAMSRFSAEPHECLILEDNENGIKAAIASGAHLLKINEVNDVNYKNIKNRIIEISNI